MKGPDISCLAQQWLENERQCSGAEQMWTEDSRWLREVWAGKSLASHEVVRWLSLSGYDVRETELEDGRKGGTPLITLEGQSLRN